MTRRISDDYSQSNLSNTSGLSSESVGYLVTPMQKKAKNSNTKSNEKQMQQHLPVSNQRKQSFPIIDQNNNLSQCINQNLHQFNVLPGLNTNLNVGKSSFKRESSEMSESTNFGGYNHQNNFAHMTASMNSGSTKGNNGQNYTTSNSSNAAQYASQNHPYQTQPVSNHIHQHTMPSYFQDQSKSQPFSTALGNQFMNNNNILTNSSTSGNNSSKKALKINKINSDMNEYETSCSPPKFISNILQQQNQLKQLQQQQQQHPVQNEVYTGPPYFGHQKQQQYHQQNHYQQPRFGHDLQQPKSNQFETTSLSNNSQNISNNNSNNSSTGGMFQPGNNNQYGHIVKPGQISNENSYMGMDGNRFGFQAEQQHGQVADSLSHGDSAEHLIKIRDKNKQNEVYGRVEENVNKGSGNIGMINANANQTVTSNATHLTQLSKQIYDITQVFFLYLHKFYTIKFLEMYFNY